jgi:hypothetical protein
MTIIPWKQGKIPVWGATCPDTIAPSHNCHSWQSGKGGAVANDAEIKKHAKYYHLESIQIFMPVEVETLGAFGRETKAFNQDLDW